MQHNEQKQNGVKMPGKDSGMCTNSMEAARLCQREQRWTEAVSYAKMALKEEETAEAYELIARGLSELGDRFHAVAMAQEALVRDPMNQRLRALAAQLRQRAIQPIR